MGLTPGWWTLLGSDWTVLDPAQLQSASEQRLIMETKAQRMMTDEQEATGMLSSGNLVQPNNCRALVVPQECVGAIYIPNGCCGMNFYGTLF